MEVLTWIAKVLAGLALLAVLLYLLIHTFFRVNENYRGIVYRAGRYVRTEKPGIGLKIPLIDTVTQVSLQQTLLSLTLKDVFGEMIAYIRYSIREHDVRAAVEQLDKPLEQIKAAAINAARPHLAGKQFEEVLAAASDIINAITTAMADFEDYGYIIEEVTTLRPIRFGRPRWRKPTGWAPRPTHKRKPRPSCARSSRPSRVS
jgi:regulator of protease activity HflC (stomatin/prohibitin superfamily)